MRTGRRAIAGRREVIGAGLGVVVGLALWRRWPRGGSRVELRREPLRFAVYPFQDLEGAVSGSVLETVRKRLCLRPAMNFSQYLHWLQIFGVRESPEYQAEATREVLSLLTDAGRLEERSGQANVIVPTEDGVRFLVGQTGDALVDSSRPAHPFQALGVFGEVGLPASTPIVASGGDFTLKDAVRDCLSNLQIREAARQEPEWATQVLAHYLPPACSWRNRWGEDMTIERWAEFLAERDVTRYSCAGTHLLHSLAVLLQAGAAHPILSAELADHLRGVCREYSRTIEATQEPNGAWRSDWSKGGLAREYRSLEVHMAGHILEAQMYLPEELRISPRCAARALKYLAQAFAASDDNTVFEEHCPYSHAGGVLLRCGAQAG